MDKIEKIRQEIERRRLHFNKEAEKYQALNYGYSQNCYGARDALRDIENFLDTLSEEPDKSMEQPEVDLEKEMDRFFEEMPVLEYENIFEETYQMIARHFYELGLNARKNEEL